MREALINALCHRQYDQPGGSVSLAIYDDRVEIINPGKFPNAITPESIKLPHDSFPFNPVIADVLYLSTYLESWGSGAKRIIDACKENGIPDPVWQSQNGCVSIVFFRRNCTENCTEKLTDKQREIIKLIEADAAVTLEKMAKATGLSRRAVANNIKELKLLGVLAREGSDKKGRWVLLVEKRD